jgi:dTDP-4-amino-4,6-dideoxygalactose transaminase
LRLKKAFGVDRSHGERKVPGVYDVVELGFNYRMSEIHAAIGIAQLKKLPSYLAQRQVNHQALAQGLAGTAGISLLGSSTNRLVSSHYCAAVMLAPGLAAKRPDIMAALTQRGVGTSVYYPQPVPRMTYYARKNGWIDGSFPNAEWLADSSIAMTVGPHTDADDMAYMASSLKSVLAEVRP